jgi:hypothetical protein
MSYPNLGLVPLSCFMNTTFYPFFPFCCVLHIICFYFSAVIVFNYRSQWPRGLGRKSTAARLLRSWVRIPPEVWMFVCCVYCVLSDRGLCDELITRPEDSYQLWFVDVCDQEIS